MARREDDKCASYGSLFIGQSSGRFTAWRSSRAAAPIDEDVVENLARTLCGEQEALWDLAGCLPLGCGE